MATTGRDIPRVNLSRTGWLSPLLRRDNIDSLNVQLNSLGSDMNNVFFKCTDKNIYHAYKHAFDDRIILRNYMWNNTSNPISTDNANPLVREFYQLSRMYEHRPKNITMPIALGVVDLTCVGYFSEYVDGNTMEMTLDHFDPERQIRLFKETISTVFTLHRNGIGHGDINPRNIMVTQDDTIKLIDPLVPYESFSNESLIRGDRIDLAGILIRIRHLKKESQKVINGMATSVIR